MITIEEPKMIKLTFNFFKRDNCSDFRFCRSYSLKREDVLKLAQLSPEERLEELKDFLANGNKGLSCEFYWQGEFIQCGTVSEQIKNRSENMKRIKKK